MIVLDRLTPADLERLAQRAERDLGRALPLRPEARDALIEMADGDGRALLNLVEQVAAWKLAEPLSTEALSTRLMRRAAKYDKSGDEHYNLISALHKSLRGSDPQDGALLSRADADGRRRTALRAAPPRTFRERRHRPCRPAGAHQQIKDLVAR